MKSEHLPVGNKSAKRVVSMVLALGALLLIATNMWSQTQLQESEHWKSLAEQRTLERNIAVALLLVSCCATTVAWLAYRRQKARETSMANANEHMEEQRKKFQRSLQEKDALLKEIHHRVKNNMQIVSSIFLLQSRQIKDPAALLAINESQSRVKAMALVHQKVYQNEDMASVDFQDYLSGLCGQIAATANLDQSQVQTQIDAENIHLNVDTAVPLGLIVHELVSNAYKFAFAEKQNGKVGIHLQSLDGNTYQLLVKDNGVGLPAGFNIANAQTLGLKLVRLLTEQLNGSVAIRPGPGTEISITFKSTP